MSGVTLKLTVVDSSGSKVTEPGSVKDQSSVPVEVCEKVIVSSVFALSLLTVTENVAALLGSTLICVVSDVSDVPYTLFWKTLPLAVSLLFASPTD